MEGAPPPPGRRVDRRLKEDNNAWTNSIASPISVGSDFFEDADMTGEVMNLDDFLKELQSNETSSRPASTPPVRLSVFQSVGRAPELKIRTNSSETLEPSLATVAVVPPEDQKPAIPKASVRPQLREMGGGTGKRKAATSTVVRGVAQVKKERLDPLEEEEEGAAASSKTSSTRKSSREDQEGFTTTVCVNFSADDLRLATIPGQEEDFDPATRYLLPTIINANFASTERM